MFLSERAQTFSIAADLLQCDIQGATAAGVGKRHVLVLVNPRVRFITADHAIDRWLMLEITWQQPVALSWTFMKYNSENLPALPMHTRL
jgi:hypothetical protein